MTSESPTIHVRPFISVLDGRDPVRFVRELFEAGYNRFYVKVPKGFRVSHLSIDPFPPGYQLLYSLQPTQVLARLDGTQAKIRYLQLDTSQLRALLEHPPIDLEELKGGGLESTSTRDGLLSIDFKYRKVVRGVLVPTEQEIADKVLTAFDVSSVAPVVEKKLNDSRSQYSYVLRGINLKDVFIEESALSDALESMRTAKAVAASVCDDLPDDPYGLRDSSPLVYAILCKAHLNRGKTRGQIDTPSLAAQFRELNANYKKNPKPFNDGRHSLAANLANPGYKYSSEGLREKRDSSISPVEVPPDAFFDQDFINENFGKLLYAACRWSGAIEPRLEGEGSELVNLLAGLGFFDADESDQVASLVFFITGEKYRRDKIQGHFKDERRDRK